MQIFAKGSYSFGPGLKKDGTTDKFVTVPNLFMDMPDRFSDDPLFKDCLRLGLVRVTASSVDAEKVIDNNKANTLLDDIKAMTHDELVAEAKELGLELSDKAKDKEIRKAIYNAKK